MKMDDFSTLVGGIAGDGINEAGLTISRLFTRLGYCTYMYYDYPSLIRGGHNFSLVRASKKKIGAHRDEIDVLIALNQETFDKHKSRLKDSALVIYDEDRVKPEGHLNKGLGLAVTQILKEAEAPAIMKNTCILGGYCKAVGIDWSVLEEVLRKHLSRKLEQNLLVARQGYDRATQLCSIEGPGRGPDVQMKKTCPVITGNQALSLGLIRAGLAAYVAYPMTPSSGVLDFMARYAKDFGLKVVHPENEISVMLMAQGFAYAGVKAAVGTSGGGFCLMTEGLSLAGMAEMPVVVVLAQRTGPSTGLPTYTAQGDLHFVLNAGQGEFPRFVVAPGDAEEAYFWAAAALNLSWKYQIPSFILTDKTVSEGQYSIDIELAGIGASEIMLKEEEALIWKGQGQERYGRYRHSETGVSPLAFPPEKGQAIKTNSYTHDEEGITSEEPEITVQMSDKRTKKGAYLARELEAYKSVSVSGNKSGKTAILCWGSNRGVCQEAAERLNMRMVHVLVLSPFPEKKLKEALQGVERLVAVECNSTGQLSRLAGSFGIKSDELILKYDGRPFSVEELEKRLGRVQI